MDTAGDGFFAAFDDPGAAVDCGVAIAHAVAPLGLAVRAGVHVGEVTPGEGKVGGIAVSTAARLLALANPGEVLVTSTVRELTAGADHRFEDRGTHRLKGVPGEWRLFAVPTGAIPGGTVGVPAADARGRRRTLVGVVALVSLAVLGGAAALALGGRPRFTPGPDTVVALSASDGSVIGGGAVGRGPVGVAAVEGGAWVASVDAGTVSRIDGEGRVTSVGGVGDHPTRVAAWDGRAFVSDPYEGRLTILPPDGPPTALRGLRARDVAAGAAGTWIVDDVLDRVSRLDPVSGRVSTTVELPPGSGPTALVVAPDAVWVAATRSQRAIRVDPVTGRIVDEVALADPPTAAAWVNGALWLVSTEADRVVRIGADGTTQRWDVGDAPTSIAGTASGIWVSASLEGRVWQLGADGRVLRQIELDGVPAAVSAAGDVVWVAVRSY